MNKPPVVSIQAHERSGLCHIPRSGPLHYHGSLFSVNQYPLCGDNVPQVLNLILVEVKFAKLCVQLLFPQDPQHYSLRVPPLSWLSLCNRTLGFYLALLCLVNLTYVLACLWLCLLNPCPQKDKPSGPPGPLFYISSYIILSCFIIFVNIINMWVLMLFHRDLK